MKAIQVRRNGDSNIIRWVYEGIRYSLTWGKHNDQLEKARLALCANIIYQDCLGGEFDSSFNKYRYWLLGIVNTGNGNDNGNGDGKRSQRKLPDLTKLVEDRVAENYNAADDGLLRLLTAVFMYLYHKLISVFLSSFAPTLRERLRRMRLCVRYKNVVHLPENRCKKYKKKIDSPADAKDFMKWLDARGLNKGQTLVFAGSKSPLQNCTSDFRLL